MNLGDLIKALEAFDPGVHVPMGFGNPHSYRGYYDAVGFEPVRDTTAGAMLAAARSADGAIYEGYKGGEFKMHGASSCYLANWGACGEEIGPLLLAFMLGRPNGGWPGKDAAGAPPAPTGTPEPVTMESQCDLAEWQRAIEAAREVLDAAVQRGMGESA